MTLKEIYNTGKDTARDLVLAVGLGATVASCAHVNPQVMVPYPSECVQEKDLYQGSSKLPTRETTVYCAEEGVGYRSTFLGPLCHDKDYFFNDQSSGDLSKYQDISCDGDIDTISIGTAELPGVWYVVASENWGNVDENLGPLEANPFWTKEWSKRRQEVEEIKK